MSFTPAPLLSSSSPPLENYPTGSRSSTSKTITIKRLPPSLMSFSKNATLSKVYTGEGGVLGATSGSTFGAVSLSRLTWIVAGICVFIAAILVLGQAKIFVFDWGGQKAEKKNSYFGFGYVLEQMSFSGLGGGFEVQGRKIVF